MLQNQKKAKLSIILLAAGSSSRLGEPKQLLPFKQQVLVQERVSTIQNAFKGACEVVVVTGAKRKEVKLALRGLDYLEAFNAHFSDGMSTSVKTGLQHVSSNTDAAMFLLVDQPFISEKHLIEMEEKWQQMTKKVVAASYAGILGVPAIFPASYFDLLQALSGDQGARKVLMKLPANDVLPYHLPEASVDIDTLEDLKQIGL